MSTTIPFTLIEGAIALPSTRPLGPVSRTLGREWALLPPSISLRVELKALYAALLRTFCLSSQAMRTMCKWDNEQVASGARETGALPVQAVEAAASAALVGPAVHAAVADSAINSAASAAAYAASGGGRPRQIQAPHRRSDFRLGSAVAIGGAAVLAWIVLDHPARHAPAPRLVSAEVKPAAAPVTTPPTPHVQPVVRATEQPALDAAPATMTDRSAAVSTAGESPVQAVATDSAHARHRSTAHTIEHAGITPPSNAVYTASSVATYSAAGDYSPVEPRPLATGEYTAVRMTARTSGDAQPLPPSRPSMTSDSNIESGWMSHLSQRRVTEVPELFSQ